MAIWSFQSLYCPLMKWRDVKYNYWQRVQYDQHINNCMNLLQPPADDDKETVFYDEVTVSGCELDKFYMEPMFIPLYQPSTTLGSRVFVYALNTHLFRYFNYIQKFTNNTFIFEGKGAFNIYINKILTYFYHQPIPNKQTQWIKGFIYIINVNNCLNTY